jgi:hypothetical protein
MATKTVMTDAQTWLREYTESDEWVNNPRGTWAQRRLFDIHLDHECGNGPYCAFEGENGRSGKAMEIRWDEVQRIEDFNPTPEYPTG